MFTGCGTALVTPFRQDGSLDEPALRGLVRRQIEEGIDFLVPCGTTGESPTLTHQEHLRVVEITLEEAKGKVPVVAGAGGYNTAEVIALARELEAMGADGLLSVTPYYNKPTQEGLYRHFAAIAEAVDLPMVLYNIPPRCVVNMTPETIARLARIPQVVAVKEATGSMDQASQILASTDLTLLSGDDSLTLPLLALGARGVVSVVANLIPRDMMALLAAFESGDLLEARRWHYKLFPLCRDMLGLATNPIPIKAAMQMLGRDTGELRMPMTPLTPDQQAKLRKTLSDYGLL
jgi:4-hydroxy-tetrahydrodipicolinate synthase